MTNAGPLDLLGTVTKSRSYDELKEHTQMLPIGDDLEVRILDLETLIMLKEETGRAKDQAVLAILRQTLEEKKRD
jgi:hypothetical protein